MDAPSDAPAPDLKQKRRKRWGTETDQGLKILEAVQTGADGDAGVAAAQPTLPVEPLPRKKKSRWAQEEELLPPPPPLLDPSLLPPGAVLLQAPVAAPLPPPPQPDQGSDHAEITKAIAQVGVKLAALAAGQIPEEFLTPGARSPSLEPTYNEEGVRTNSRIDRIIQRLERQRDDLVAELLHRKASSSRFGDLSRLNKRSRKVPIPDREYPHVNFFGLLIGPRGNTQKRLEQESGARIVIRGRGSARDNRPGGLGSDPSDNEDLHVLVTADNDESLDKACAMVEDLLKSHLEDNMSEHKRMQLRELAALNGTLRDHDDFDRGRSADRDMYPPPPDMGRGRAERGPSSAREMESEYHSFMRDIGGAFGERPRSPRTRSPRARSPRVNGFSDGPPRGTGFSDGPGPARSGGFTDGALPPPPPLGAEDADPRDHRDMRDARDYRDMRDRDRDRDRDRYRDRDEPDPASVYVGFLAPHIDERDLHHLFSGVAQVMDCKVIRDRGSGMSKGFAFVRLANEYQANLCCERLNLFPMGGRRISVRPRGSDRRPPPGPGGGPGGPYGDSGYPHHESGPAYPTQRLYVAHDELPPGVEEEAFVVTSDGIRAQVASTSARPSRRESEQADLVARRQRLERLGMLYARPTHVLLQPNAAVAHSSHAPRALGPAGDTDMEAVPGLAEDTADVYSGLAEQSDVYIQPVATSVRYTLDTAPVFLYGPLPDWEPSIPGLEHEAQQAALLAAATAGHPIDLAQIMSEDELNAFLATAADAHTDATHTAAAAQGGAAAPSADEGAAAPPGAEGAEGAPQPAKKKRIRNRKAATGAPGTEAEEGVQQPAVVQVVELDPEAIERARKRKEEEEAARAKAAEEKEQRLRDIERRRREEMMEAAAARQPPPAPATAKPPQLPAPPPVFKPPTRPTPHTEPTTHTAPALRPGYGRRTPSRSRSRSHSRSRSRSTVRFRSRSRSRSARRARSSTRSRSPVRGGRPGMRSPPRGRYSRSRSPSRSPVGRWGPSRSRSRSPAGRRPYKGSPSPPPSARRGGPSRGRGPARSPSPPPPRKGRFAPGGRSPTPPRRYVPEPAPPKPQEPPSDQEEGEIEDGEVEDDAPAPSPQRPAQRPAQHDAGGGSGRRVSEDGYRGGRDGGAPYRQERERDRGPGRPEGGRPWPRDGGPGWREGPGGRGGGRGFRGGRGEHHSRDGPPGGPRGYGGPEGEEGFYEGMDPNMVMQAAMMQQAAMLAMMQQGYDASLAYGGEEEEGAY